MPKAFYATLELRPFNMERKQKQVQGWVHGDISLQTQNECNIRMEV